MSPSQAPEPSLLRGALTLTFFALFTVGYFSVKNYLDKQHVDEIASLVASPKIDDCYVMDIKSVPGIIDVDHNYQIIKVTKIYNDSIGFQIGNFGYITADHAIETAKTVLKNPNYFKTSEIRIPRSKITAWSRRNLIRRIVRTK